MKSQKMNIVLQRVKARTLFAHAKMFAPFSFSLLASTRQH